MTTETAKLSDQIFDALDKAFDELYIENGDCATLCGKQDMFDVFCEKLDEILNSKNEYMEKELESTTTCNMSKTNKKPDVFLIFTDAIFSALFWGIFLGCIHGILKGAYWHIFTASVCIIAMCFFYWDIRKEFKRCDHGRTHTKLH